MLRGTLVPVELVGAGALGDTEVPLMPATACLRRSALEVKFCVSWRLPPNS